MMNSEQTGRQYRITISLPYAYCRPEVKGWPFENPPEKWPVIYLLDGNLYFGMVTDMIRSMAWWLGSGPLGVSFKIWINGVIGWNLIHVLAVKKHMETLKK